MTRFRTVPIRSQHRGEPPLRMTSLSTPSRGVHHWLLHAGSSTVVCAFIFLAWRSHHGGVNLTSYAAAITVAWLGFLLAWRTDRVHLLASPRTLILWALAARLAAGISLPVLEDDPWRYLWDGYQTAVHGTPYGTPPADSFADPNVPASLQRVLDRINHPDLPTVYGPTAQLAFFASYGVAPGQLWPWKWILFVADAGVGLLLVRSRISGAGLFWALCPLVLQSTFVSAHIDGLGVALALGAVFASRSKRPALSAFLLAAAFGVRPIAILLSPWILARNRRAWLICLMGILALHAPFQWLGGWGLTPDVLARLQSWEFNSSLFAVVRATVGTELSHWICGALFAGFWVWCASQPLRQRPDPLTLPPSSVPGDWVFGVLWLASPVVNPWYLLWLAPFVALRPSIWGVTALAAVALSYATGLRLGTPELGNFGHPAWLRPVEYGAIIAALVLDYTRRRRSRGPEEPPCD